MILTTHPNDVAFFSELGIMADQALAKNDATATLLKGVVGLIGSLADQAGPDGGPTDAALMATEFQICVTEAAEAEAAGNPEVATSALDEAREFLPFLLGHLLTA